MQSVHTHSQTGRPAPSSATILSEQSPAVEGPCVSLIKLANYIPLHGMDWSARRVAEALCNFFDAECRHHHQEQETGLFRTLLRQAGDSDTLRRVEALIQELRGQHQTLVHSWQQMRQVLSDIAFCRPTTLSGKEAVRFATLYRDHVELEERLLRPLSSQILGAQLGMAQ